MPGLSVSVLRLRNFRFLLLARFLTTFGYISQGVIVGWQVYSITKDPFMLGLIGLTEAVPAIACALFAGHLVDISRPKTVYMACEGSLAVLALALLLVAGGFVPVPEGWLIPLIFGGIFISGLARSFIMPSSFSLLAEIVPRKDMPAATSWLTTGFQVAAICGPAVAGLVYGGYGARAAWLIPVSFLTMAFVMVIAIAASPRRIAAAKRDPAIQSILAGWRFILKNPTLLSVMSLDMFAVLFGGAVAMLPAYADQVLHVGSEGLGALRAAPALGAVITALIFALQPMKKISAMRLLWMVAGFGACMIGFGLSQHFWLSMFFLALSGSFDSVSMIIRSTLMQLLTPDTMRGRVSAVNSMFIISSNEIGAFESGLAARVMGLVPSVVFGGCATLAVVAVTAWASPKFRKTVVRTDES